MDAGNYKTVSLALIPGTVMQQVTLGTTSKCVEDEKVAGSSECGFMK